MCADILNLPVRVLMTEENAAFGAALQAYWVYEKQRGNPKSITQITKDHLVVDESKSCLPNPSTVKEYEKIYQNYQTFVKLITKHYQ
jgi:xylulokinase